VCRLFPPGLLGGLGYSSTRGSDGGLLVRARLFSLSGGDDLPLGPAITAGGNIVLKSGTGGAVVVLALDPRERVSAFAPLTISTLEADSMDHSASGFSFLLGRFHLLIAKTPPNPPLSLLVPLSSSLIMSWRVFRRRLQR
jgi:hypothetical protein